MGVGKTDVGMDLPEWKLYERHIFAKLKEGVAADAEVTFDDRER